MEMTNSEMYNKYGIGEWREKNLILSEAEREALATATPEDIFIYVTRKHLYPSMTTKDLSNYLSKDFSKIQRLELQEKSSNI